MFTIPLSPLVRFPGAIIKSPKTLCFQGFSMALQGNFDTIAVRVHFGARGCIRVQFVLILVNAQNDKQ
jgi:hypothetical protein